MYFLMNEENVKMYILVALVWRKHIYFVPSIGLVWYVKGNIGSWMIMHYLTFYLNLTRLYVSKRSDDPCVSSIVAADVKIKHLGDNAFWNLDWWLSCIISRQGPLGALFFSTQNKNVCHNYERNSSCKLFFVLTSVWWRQHFQLASAEARKSLDEYHIL